MKPEITITEAMDKIKEYQAELGYAYRYNSLEDRMVHVRDLALALTVEVSEFLEWLPHKSWRPVHDQEFNVEEATLELVDIFFFMSNLLAAIGQSPKDFTDLFERKLEENYKRIERGYNKQQTVDPT